MGKGKRGEWVECTNGTLQKLHAICVKCACHFLFVANSQGVADGASLLYTTPQPTTLNVLRPSPSPTARLTMQDERVTHFHSSTDRILSTATASSSRQVVLRNSFDAKVGASHGSTICCSTPELTRTATPAREKCMRPSCRTKVPQSFLIRMAAQIG